MFTPALSAVYRSDAHDLFREGWLRAERRVSNDGMLVSHTRVLTNKAFSKTFAAQMDGFGLVGCP